MARIETSEREKFVARLVYEFRPAEVPDYVYDCARRIMRIAPACKRHAVNDWNRGTTEAEDRANARRVARVARIMSELYAIARLEAPETVAWSQGDPRGYTLRLALPSGRGNTWGGDEEGWGVPGS